MQLMGHKDIRMTLRYLKVTQPDLQREFYNARHTPPWRLAFLPSQSLPLPLSPTSSA